jgi:hypothetical protein
MPKIAIDYSKTVIYKIICCNTDITNCYVGHTTSFRHRKSVHKHNCNNENSKHYNYKVYKIIRANGGWDNWNMLPIEEYPCENHIQAQIKEREWYDKLNASMNCCIPNTSQIESTKNWTQKNIEHVHQVQKQYREKNKQKLIEIKNKKFTCQCGGKYTNSNKSRHETSNKHLAFIELNNSSNANIDGGN